MSKSVETINLKHREKIKVLCVLSDVKEPADFSYFSDVIKKSPDPETAIANVLNNIPVSSEILTSKWHEAITDLWALYHPDIPLIPQLLLSENLVSQTRFFQDTKRYLEILAQKPARIHKQSGELLIDADDAYRIAKELPSNRGIDLMKAESEWSYYYLYRLRMVLQSLRMVRVVKGQLLSVKSRVNRFNNLPAKHQFYILWHADTRHLSWHLIAGLWGDFTQLIQNYLPLLWETIGDVESNDQESRNTWIVDVLETFLPLWEEAGLLKVNLENGGLGIARQHAIPTIIDHFLLRDLFERHGLVKISNNFGDITNFTWTEVGKTIITAERSQRLPCGNEILNGNHQENDHFYQSII